MNQDDVLISKALRLIEENKATPEAIAKQTYK